MEELKRWSRFSRICPRIVARRCGSTLAYFLSEFGARAFAPGLESAWRPAYSRRRTYEDARDRLLEAGIVGEITRKGEIVLELTDRGESMLPACLRPTRLWNRKWNGTWYVVSYDVPEASREHRRVIQELLRRERFGALHESMWIGPWDIRPLFDDLRAAAGIGDYAALLQARTVMGGVPDAHLVRRAWPWVRIDAAQERFGREVRTLLERWEARPPKREAVIDALRAEAAAYLECMDRDPLLPRRLWPDGYQGQAAFDLHRAFCDEATRRLKHLQGPK